MMSYIVNRRIMFTNILLYLSLTCLIIKPKLRFELGFFTKQTNINKYFSSQTQVIYGQFSSFINPPRAKTFFFFFDEKTSNFIKMKINSIHREPKLTQ